MRLIGTINLVLSLSFSLVCAQLHDVEPKYGAPIRS